MPTSKAKELRYRRCARKVAYHTMDEAQAQADELARTIIYDIYQPQAYRCDYGRHYHVGHGLNPDCPVQRPIIGAVERR